MDAEIVAIFVYHEELGVELPGKRPFPLGHQRFGGADDAGEIVMARGEGRVEAAARIAAAILVHVEDFSAESLGRIAEAGDQIDLEGLAVDFEEMRDQAVEDSARSAFDQQNPAKGRDTLSKESAQRIILFGAIDVVPAAGGPDGADDGTDDGADGRDDSFADVIAEKTIVSALSIPSGADRQSASRADTEADQRISSAMAVALHRNFGDLRVRERLLTRCRDHHHRIGAGALELALVRLAIGHRDANLIAGGEFVETCPVIFRLGENEAGRGQQQRQNPVHAIYLLT